MKTVIKAEIVAHSINEQGDELISVLATFPRIILAEMNTHRMLSKNTSSSRAIPFNKMVESIKEDPFIPIAWQKEHKGMQGSEYIKDIDHLKITIDDWLKARDNSIEQAEKLSSGFEDELSETDDRIDKVTKQLCNRLLEPFMWTTMLITGPKSGWENFFNLRCPSYTFHTDESEKDFVFKSKKDAINHFGVDETVEYPSGEVLLKDLHNIQWLQVNTGQAEIHMMALAECIWDAYNESTPIQLEAGQWHIPFWKQIPFISGTEGLQANTLKTVKISVAMAARTSYTVVGEEKGLDYKALIGLHDRLLSQDPPHSSPLEHCARAMSDEEHGSYIKGKIDLIDVDEPEYNGGIYEPKFSEKGWCNNFKGFIPYRYLVDNKISI